MNEIGIINREIAYAIAKQGHGDLLMVVDAGFAIPEEVKVIDLSIEVNKLIENDEKDLMITYSDEGILIWTAYFAWADEMATIE